MTVPITRFREIPISTAVVALDTAAERIGAITSEVVKATGVGQEVDFGVVEISEGAADSAVHMLLWDVTANGGNTIVDTFKMWLSSLGFDISASELRFAALSGADQGSPVNTENYVVNAITSSYTFVTLPETSEPGSQNVWPSDEGTSMDISGGASDDAIMWAIYAHIAVGETTGTYKGTDAGLELQASFKFSLS